MRNPLRLTKKQKCAWDEVRRALKNAKAAGLGWANDYGSLVPYQRAIVEKIIPEQKSHDENDVIPVNDIPEYWDNEIKLDCYEMSDDPHFIVLKPSSL